LLEIGDDNDSMEMKKNSVDEFDEAWTLDRLAGPLR